MKAFVDKEKCIGCEVCTLVCPNVFRMEGEFAVASDSVTPEDFDTTREACDSCPSDAISIEE